MSSNDKKAGQEKLELQSDLGNDSDESSQEEEVESGEDAEEEEDEPSSREDSDSIVDDSDNNDVLDQVQLQPLPLLADGTSPTTMPSGPGGESSRAAAAKQIDDSLTCKSAHANLPMSVQIPVAGKNDHGNHTKEDGADQSLSFNLLGNYHLQ